MIEDTPLTRAVIAVEAIKHEHSDPPVTAEMAAVGGIAWTRAALAPYGIDNFDASDVAERVMNITRDNLLRLHRSGVLSLDEAITAGFGAGWFNGLAVGLRVPDLTPPR